MKKIILLVTALVSFTGAIAQEGMSYGFGVGLNGIADQCAVLNTNFVGIDGNATYNFNEKLGVGVYGGYSRLGMVGIDSNYFRGNLELESDVLKLANLDVKNFLLLVHGGPGISYNSATSELMPNLGGGADLIYMLTERLGVGLGWRSTGNFAQDITLNNSHATTNRGINSNVHNAFARLVWRPKPKRTVVEEVNEVDRLNERVTELNRKVSNIKSITVEKCCDDNLFNEYVYFDFDKYNVHRSELAAIESGIEKAGDAGKLRLVGYACPRFGTDEYNYKLANKRVDRVAAICEELGFPSDRIITEVVGKDVLRNSDNAEVRAMARRVDIIVEK